MEGRWRKWREKRRRNYMTNTEENTQVKHRVLAGRQVLGKLETMLVRHEEETGQGQNQGTSGGIILNKRTALRRNYEEFIPRRKPVGRHRQS